MNRQYGQIETNNTVDPDYEQTIWTNRSKQHCRPRL